ncbi:hypothetical protein AVEN_157382-1 [Araneus ventricosus]|uniref:Uncharacterized protein n=1 Tax=Araneus ventricosus TaxID=182803 RepID=A0A4Y2QZY6_ARAVE|nr:hypothetical protein AVEN_157382-1 [Araneus ventricosus]
MAQEQSVPRNDECPPPTRIVLNATGQTFYLEEPFMTEIMYSEPPLQDDINKLLEEFGMDPIPNEIVLPSTLPPLPDNYFGETVEATIPELPVVWDEVQDLPLDLSTNCTVGPRKEHVFAVTYSLDLRVRN